MAEVDQFKGAHDAVQDKLTAMSRRCFCLGSAFVLALVLSLLID